MNGLVRADRGRYRPQTRPRGPAEEAFLLVVGLPMRCRSRLGRRRVNPLTSAFAPRSLRLGNDDGQGALTGRARRTAGDTSSPGALRRGQPRVGVTGVAGWRCGVTANAWARESAEDPLKASDRRRGLTTLGADGVQSCHASVNVVVDVRVGQPGARVVRGSSGRRSWSAGSTPFARSRRGAQLVLASVLQQRRCRGAAARNHT